MNKTAIKNFAVWARQKLIEDIIYKAGLLGISNKGIIEALPQSTNDLKFFDIGTKNYVEVAGREIKQREALISAIKNKEKETNSYQEAFEYIVEEVAYTWFNRLIAIRFMEVNDYLPSRIRVLSSENKAKNEPDFVTNPFEADLDLSAYEQDKIIELKDTNKSDELFRMLFIKQCNKLHEILPRLFEKTDDYTELLLTISYTDKDGIIYHLIHDIDEDDFNVEKEGQIEIIGWLYQYYNIEPKATVFSRAKGQKIKKEQIPAATQLFTPDWIVRYMVENSLGRLWYEGHSDSNIKDNWKYYLDEAEQESEVQIKLDAIREEYKTIKPEEIKLIDPCMGSGHILVYAFDVFMQIYESYGYTQRDAASLIVENNIFGLDIDERAAQLTYFAVMMKGRQYDRRFLTRGIKPHVYDVPEIKAVDKSTIDAFGDCADIAKRVCDSFIDGKEYGSLINPKVSFDEIDKLDKKIEQMKSDTVDIFSHIALKIVEPLMDIVRILVQKYDISVTNPPYMAVSSAGAKLNDYVKKYYPDSKADLFSVFIERSTELIKKNRFQAMITMHSWMFLSSFEKLREKLLSLDTVNMAHLGARAFEEISGEVVQTTSFVFRKSNISKFKGTYCRLIEPNTQDGKEAMFLERENRFEVEQDNFSKIPGSPIAYWISKGFQQIFKDGEQITKYISSRDGLTTGNNELFVKQFWEVPYTHIMFNCTNAEEFWKSEKKFAPLIKGGLYRKWYGNNWFVITYDKGGFQKLSNSGNKLPSREVYFLPYITWNRISTRMAFRYCEAGYIFESASLIAVSDTYENHMYALAFANSVVAKDEMQLINPTTNMLSGYVDSLKIPRQSEHSMVIQFAKENVYYAKKDWDSFETSWDFEEHPLVRWSKSLWDCTAIASAMSNYYGDKKPEQVSGSLELCYLLWQGECNERFNQLKANEEELNHIFIDIYGLQDELTPEVEDKDVTVRKADLQRDIKSLISYAVGCMLGRYSLDCVGLAFAGGDWDETKYKSFIPDQDNCIPITDEEYFEDDIVGRFVNFMRIAFGEDDLEVNLNFVAKALGNKGKTSREVIRNYFLNDFIKDHIKTYQKRPIYWLFDSGKQNGFKALCYMHRWNADTIGNVRVEYLHRMQRVYDKEMDRMQEIIDNSKDNKEINAATKRKEKLQKQLKETKDYDAMIAHLALSRIDIDLDDGVKVNYDKVQTVDGKKMQVLSKI
ncbi:MAG: BREX-1 system adenine-specific DNA-methyltransferase PglX [Eubacteriales bacterium]|nr:BREX-1 system adenine-specific DNA-methyltransferase PglX [Eubacteriales bacterium]